MDRCKEEYKSSSDRYRGYDYSLPGIYFITIDTFNRNPILGNINIGHVNLSESGQIARKFWLEIPAHFINVRLDDYVIMPDHMHGLIVIENKTDNSVTRLCATSNHSNDHMSLISPRSGELGTIIRSYKSAVSKAIHQIFPAFKWQPGYYDHIVRTYDELLRIQSYIIANPQKWNHGGIEIYPW